MHDGHFDGRYHVKETGLARFEKVRKIMPKILDVEQSSQSVVRDLTDFVLPNELWKVLGFDHMEFNKQNNGSDTAIPVKRDFGLTSVRKSYRCKFRAHVTKTFKENKKTVKSLYLDEKGCRDQLSEL